MADSDERVHMLNVLCFKKKGGAEKYAEYAAAAAPFVQELGLGLSDRDIGLLATRAARQSWFSMCADGAGVDLDGGALPGPAVERERAIYQSEQKLRDLDCAEPGSPERRSASGWIETAEQGDVFESVSRTATQRWGCVPHVLRAVSLLPEMLERHAYMLELLERPQSESLPARTHARVRARVAELNRSSWAQPTLERLLEREASGSTKSEGLVDELALALATKLVATPWKVTEKDARAFRDAGLDDEAYLDVLNTTAIQNALDRLCWALGVPADPKALLAAF